MGWLSAFGTRNHPATKQGRRAMQRAREGMTVSDETVATYRAARAFLLAEWFGASVMVASFTLLYLFATPGGPSAPVAMATCISLFAVGGWVFWSSHRYYKRLEFPWARRWDTAALVLAGSGAVFWLLFALLQALILLGIRIQ